jgi:hypothetical protein
MELKRNDRGCCLRLISENAAYHHGDLDRASLRPHLRYGLTIDGLFHFLVKIGFLIVNTYSSTGYEYNQSYQRDSHLKWVDEMYGPIEHEVDELKSYTSNQSGIMVTNFSAIDGAEQVTCSKGPPVAWADETGKEMVSSRRKVNGMTGYDLCSVVRKWLEENGHESRSVCEVILTDNEFKEIRRCVSKATVFYSHIQSLDPLVTFGEMQQSQESFAVQLPLTGEQFFWLDYTSLRQCQNDFEPKQVVALVQEIGLTIAEIDEDVEYLKRSFCILELYATFAGGAQLLCQMNHMRAILMEHGPQLVDARAAATRSIQDKQLIDGFIESEIGFETFNRTVAEAVADGTQTLNAWFSARIVDLPSDGSLA